MDQFSFSGFSASNMLACIVDGADIYQTDYMGNRQLIGKTVSAYNELEQTTTEYYNKLVELKVIVPPKSTEEFMAEMQKFMVEMYNELKELKNREPEPCACSTGADVPQRKPKRGNPESAGSDQRDGGQP